MKKSKKTVELQEKARKFVCEVITEIYKQKPNARVVNDRVNRIVASIPRTGIPLAAKAADDNQSHSFN
jgi:hypothetical protein